MSLTDYYAGKTLLITGGTGFLGKSPPAPHLFLLCRQGHPGEDLSLAARRGEDLCFGHPEGPEHQALRP